jgi:hypothetical protein
MDSVKVKLLKAESKSNKNFKTIETPEASSGQINKPRINLSPLWLLGGLDFWACPTAPQSRADWQSSLPPLTGLKGNEFWWGHFRIICILYNGTIIFQFKGFWLEH